MRTDLESERLSSLDAMRGITIAGMILVNNPGDWKYVYAPLRHAPWHGWTPTDLILPFFLFIVGVSLSLSLSRRREQEVSLGNIYIKIIRRSSIIFALGIFLALIPRFDFATLRIPGVLQRIALCYLFSSLLFLNTGKKGRTFFAFSLLIIYWLIMKLIPVPGYGAGVLEYQGNLCAYVDSQLLSGHLYKPGFDPEGLLSTIPAISTTLLGTLTGDWLQSSIRKSLKMIGLFLAGLFLTFAGLVLHPLFPINKQLWTSTYVLFTAGVGLLILGICYSLMDVAGWRKWAYPFLVFGTNAIFVYFGLSLMAKLIPMIKIPIDSHTISLKTYIYSHLLVPWAGHVNGSLIYPVCLILFWTGVMIPLYKKNIYIKI